jgi:hypothetical protein
MTTLGMLQCSNLPRSQSSVQLDVVTCPGGHVQPLQDVLQVVDARLAHTIIIISLLPYLLF